jgi:hypothetical protein
LLTSVRGKGRDIGIPLFIGILLFIIQIIHTRFPTAFPIIEEQVFEQLIQVNATILGFTLVGMLYYIGKFDDKKKEYARHWFELLEIQSISTRENNKIIDDLLEILSRSRLVELQCTLAF